MRTEDIKPGVLYARQAGVYSRRVRPVVLLAEPTADHLYLPQGAGPALPYYTRASGHTEPRGLRRDSGLIVGWPAVTTRHDGIDPQTLLKVSLADFERVAVNDNADLAFILVTSADQILGLWGCEPSLEIRQSVNEENT